MDKLIELSGVSRDYPAGGEYVTVLKDIDLVIERGEFVAIIGSSGSGKSTLMNILGCLDHASRGTYKLSGRDIGGLGADELAELRREHFGFIFQRYQLLPDLSALENVEVPAIYAGADGHKRRARATEILTRLGLEDRLKHRPGQLSGGQQQRVSVARALINGGEVILADEPTGALDSKSGEELLNLFKELNRDGHTIIIVTHDPNVAAMARRVVEIRDGEIISDRAQGEQDSGQTGPAARNRRKNAVFASLGRSIEAFRMAIRAMSVHKLRTFLTMLGIIIGIASVVGVVALGQGSQEAVLERIAKIGTNTINIYPGTGFGDRRSARIRTLVAADADALEEQPFSDSVTPSVSTSGTIVYRNVAASGRVAGVGEGYFQVNGTEILEGQSFGEQNVIDRDQVAVIDENTRDELFTNGRDPLGEVIIIAGVPVRVIGVAASEDGFGPNSTSLNIWVPYTTAETRMLGQNYLDSITVRVADDYDMDQAEDDITTLLDERHGTTDFYLQNTNTIRETITSTSQTLTLLIAMIAVISLLVGGIGVMNIMLVSVTERTKEIGVRMAVGARRSDIMQQFLIEAVLVCLLGGVSGIVLAFAAGYGAQAVMSDLRLSYSSFTIIAAFLSSTLIGMAFGFMPARSASRLDPVDALARE